MRWLFLILFFLYIYIEISVFVAVANSIGVLLALICIIATSVLGLSLVKSQGLKNLVIMQQKMAANENPTNELIKSVSLLLAGLLLSIPGFFTDILGALLLLSPVQRFLVKRIVPKINIKTYQSNSHNNRNSNEIIEGEFTHKNDE
ncbi:FxsA family protein [Orbus sturtevantii]|uniref:FxsA family protein n=1 Tax=Orbus sturtevantii TaxID=3074109 RepID=UPI00370D21AA